MIGTRLSDRYEITGELGRGGMGVVYRARDPLLNRDVAVKLIPPGQLAEEAEQRFQREAQLVAQMDHPGIVSIYDFGRHEGSLFFVMPVVEGASLRSFRRQETVSLGDVLDVAIEVAEALEYSHARGVVHRDIKPENIMVARAEDGSVRVRVMDFGLARASSETRLTKTGTLVGTIAYLSPEQVAARPIDHRADVYALGTLLYESVLGEPPFTGETQAVLYRIVHEIPQPPRARGAEVDEELEQVILACLAKDPAQRTQSAAELAQALRRYRSRLHDSDRGRAMTAVTHVVPGRVVGSPLVGRAREFAELQQRLNAAVAGECQLALVGGEPGIGKSRLLDELESLARVRKIRVLHGRSAEQDRSFAYQGFCDLVQEYFRTKDAASGPASDVSDLAADLIALFPMLSEIPELRDAGSGSSRAPGGAPAGPENQSQIFELLARTLTRMAGGQPLVLVLEDLHQAEVSIEALQYIVRRLGPTPTLFVGTYRSTEIDARHPLTRVLESFQGDRRFSTILLAPLNPSEHRQFLETLVGGSALSDSLARRLYEGTEGNPFFTRELVRSLVDSGGIEKDDTGNWSLSTEMGFSSDALPATIQQAVEKRIERLPDELKDLLSIAAVIGRSFDYRDLEKLAEGRKDLEDAVERLVAEGYLEEERESRGDVLTFSSGVVRDVLYARLSRRKRRSLHRQFAELLEGRHAGRLERVLPQLVHHFYQGDVPEKTVEHALRLARASLDAFSAEEASRSARAALEFLDEEWSGERALEGEAHLLLARASRMAGDWEGALKEADAALRVFEREAQASRQVAALLFSAETAWQARRNEEAVRRADKGLELARAAGEADGLRPLLSLAATLANLRGEYARANELLEEAARLAPEAREAEQEGEVPHGGRLVVALPNPVKTIDPATIETNEEAEIAETVFEMLLATDPQGNLVPALCERWEAADGGRVFRFTLRKGIRFSDGAALDAATVKAGIEGSIRRAMPQMSAGFAPIRGAAEHREGKAGDVTGIVTRGDDVVEIQLTEALPIYPALLTDGSTGIVRETDAQGATHVHVGTGPFQVAAQDEAKVVLERNPNYWREGVPRLDTIEFRAPLTATAIARGFRAGEIDVARDLLPEELEELLRDPQHRQAIVETPKRNTYFVLFNALSGPAAKAPALRQALAGCVRTRDLVWRSLGRFAQPASCLIPPGMLGHDAGRRFRSLAREEAKELLRASGLESPLRLKASVHPLLRDRYASLLTGLFAEWSELGVQVEVATPDMASYLESWPKNDGLDLMIGRWNADYDDPDNFTYALFHSKEGVLRGYYSSPEADQILEEARAETRPGARDHLYRKFEALVLEPGTLLALFHDVDYRLASPRVRGLRLRGTAPYVNYPEIGRAASAKPRPSARGAARGIVRVPMAGVVASIDPARCETLEQSEVVPAVFETLTRDLGEARTVPWLASDLRVEDEGRRYRFRLRDDVRFHDGRRLSARDVRYSLERMLQARSDASWLYSVVRGARDMLEGRAGDLQGFRIHSATEFSIELEEPVGFFPALLANSSSAVVPEGSDPSAARGPEELVGTGPFRVVAFEPGRTLELERNAAYWREGYPRSEGLVFSLGVPPKEILAGFRAGRFSLATDLFPEDAEALRREREFASGYRDTPRLITYAAFFNTHRGPLAERSVRQRLVHALDVPTIVRQTLGRLATPASTWIAPGLLGHDVAQGSRGRLDSGRSRERLPTPLELQVAVHPTLLEGYSALQRAVAAGWGEIGARLHVVNRTMAEYDEAVYAASADVVLGRWGADYPDADSFLSPLQSQGGFYGKLCGSAAIDRLLARGRTEAQPALRHATYREADEELAREAILLPLFHEQVYRFTRPEVEGVKLTFGVQTVLYDEIRIRE
jgi:ABC-type transport system substrate-binding protein